MSSALRAAARAFQQLRTAAQPTNDVRRSGSVRSLRPVIRSVDQRELHALCVDLAERVGEFDPDVVVGIATGGAEVAEEIARALGGDRRLVIVKSQRPGTKIKQARSVSRLLASLPQGVADLARWVEVEYREASHVVRTLARRGDPPKPPNRVQRPDVLVQAVAEGERVLVVDDTLDSGETLSGVVDLVRSANPLAEVRSAVIATTWRRPPVLPDYVLEPRVLLRLPSSFDA